MLPNQINNKTGWWPPDDGIMQWYEKKHGWLFFSQVQPDKRQVNHTPSEISWKELFNGVWYVAKPFEQQQQKWVLVSWLWLNAMIWKNIDDY